MSIERATCSGFARNIDILYVSDARLSPIRLSLIRELPLGVLKQLINVAGILILCISAMKLTLMGSIILMLMILNFI